MRIESLNKKPTGLIFLTVGLLYNQKMYCF